MMLPFPQRTKAVWNLTTLLPQIDRVIDETNLQEFERDLAVLQPRIARHGLRVLSLDPKPYQGAWYEYQVTSLKHLRRHIEAGTFDLDKWNANVDRINAWLARQNR